MLHTHTCASISMSNNTQKITSSYYHPLLHHRTTKLTATFLWRERHAWAFKEGDRSFIFNRFFAVIKYPLKPRLRYMRKIPNMWGQSLMIFRCVLSVCLPKYTRNRQRRQLGDARGGSCPPSRNLLFRNMNHQWSGSQYLFQKFHKN